MTFHNAKIKIIVTILMSHNIGPRTFVSYGISDNVVVTSEWPNLAAIAQRLTNLGL